PSAGGSPSSPGTGLPAPTPRCASTSSHPGSLYLRPTSRLPQPKRWPICSKARRRVTTSVPTATRRRGSASGAARLSRSLIFWPCCPGSIGPTQRSRANMAKPKVLISDELSPRAVEIFSDRGCDVDFKPGLKPAELRAIVGNYEGLAIRSATKVTAEVLAEAKKLKVVGRAGIGGDDVDP